MASHQSAWHFSRALWGTSLCALGGALAPVGLALVLTLYRWLAGPTDIASEGFRRDLEEGLIYPVVGCAAVCACAGWATYAPAGKHSLVWSLAIIFLVSLVMWMTIGWMEWTPRRYKAIEHPVFYPSEMLAMIGPPSLVTAFLTLSRMPRAPRPDATGAS